MKRILITRPEYDDTTFYCSKWIEPVIELASKRRINVIDLKRKRAIRKNVEKVLKDKKPRLVLFNGHGDYETIKGHNGEILIRVNDNEKLLNSKIVHSLSCSSARILGKKSVDKRATAYIGYENDFFFFYDTNKSTKPRSDSVAKPFFESANQVAISILKGKTVRESFLKSQQTYDLWIAHYRVHGELLEAPQNLLALMWDKMSQVAHGDKEAKM